MTKHKSLIPSKIFRLFFLNIKQGFVIYIQADLNETKAEACGKCTACALDEEYCSECIRGDGGCPVDTINQIEAAISVLNKE